MADHDYMVEEAAELLEVDRNNLLRMDKQAHGIHGSSSNLLYPKQKHSIALETRFSREQVLIAAKASSSSDDNIKHWSKARGKFDMVGW